MAKGREKDALKDIGAQKTKVQNEGAAFQSNVDSALRPGYTDFATTGGYSEADKNAIRSRESSSLASLYGNLQDQLARQKSVQGGYSPGFSGQNAKMARDLASATAEGVRNTDIGIQEAVNQGKLAGLGGLGGMESLKLSGLGLTASQIAQLLGTQSNLATRPGLFDNIIKGIGATSGITSAMNIGG